MRPFRSLAAILAAAMLAAACGTGNENGPVKQGGTFRLGTIEGIDSLNPFVGFNQDSYSTWFYIYPSLVQYDLSTYKFIPNFAKSWQTSSDGLTWTFHLVHGARWTDGKPLTSRDVAWTINTILKFQSGP